MLYFGIVLSFTGIGIIMTPVVQYLINRRKCKDKIYGVYVGQYSYVNYLKLKMGNPKIKYRYQGEEYESVCWLYKYTEKEIYNEGDEVVICVDPLNPEHILMPRKAISFLGSERLLPMLVFSIVGIWLIITS